MKTVLGIDLGTSSLKALLTDTAGNILKTKTSNYLVDNSIPLWSEQNPLDWVSALAEVINKLNQEIDLSELEAITLAGQMHGLVILDKEDNIIRPCILWNDGRSYKECDYLNNEIGKDKLTLFTGNIAFPGFTLPKLLWVKNNEKENFNKITKIMLPKDYLAYYLSGAFATDYSDASGMLLLDVKNKKYSKEMLDIAGIKESMLPKLYESSEVIGVVSKNIALKLNIPLTTKIVIGGGDNAVAAIGTGTVASGDMNISLGTSGTVFISCDNFSVDKNNALHSFCHSTGKYHLMGCILTAASARSWWLEDIIKSNDYDLDELDMHDVKANDLFFVPYLNGERSPHNDPFIKGAFIGLTQATTRAQMSKAILEGVSFALRDCVEVAKDNGINPKYTALCGGGAKSKLWRQMIADIMNLETHILKTEQGPSFGACILALVALGYYPNIEAATKEIVKVKEIIYPSKKNVDYYEDKYQRFKKIYPLLMQLEVK